MRAFPPRPGSRCGEVGKQPVPSDDRPSIASSILHCYFSKNTRVTTLDVASALPIAFMDSTAHTDLGEIKVTDRFDLTGRNFLITGGGRGIGFACAKAIAQLGGGVAVIDALSEPTEQFHTLSERYGVKTSYVQGDVTNQTSLEEAFAHSVKAVGQLHGGLIAAGICIDQPLLEADWEVSQRTFNVNVMGLFWTLKLLSKHLVDTETPGSIVTIASLNGQGIYVPAQPCSAYNASKAAVKGLVGPLAGELGQYGIRVNSISPGKAYRPWHDVTLQPLTDPFKARSRRRC